VPTARSDLRLIPAIDTYPSLVRFAQTPVGKAAVLVIFGVGLMLHQKDWWLDALVILAGLTFWPGQRRWGVLAGTFYWLLRHSQFRWSVVTGVAQAEGVAESIYWPLLQGGAVVAALLFCAGFHAAARAWPKRGPLRRPIATLLISYAGLLTLGFYAPLPPVAHTAFWAFVTVLGSYLWFLGFSLLDRNARDSPNFLFHLGYYLPFWMGNMWTTTPLAKGAGNLRRIEAKSAEELAVCQLKALKLIFWAAGILALHELVLATVHGTAWRLPLPQPSFTLGLPTYQEVFAQSMGGNPAPWYTAWSALVTRFFVDLLSLAGAGHLVISVCRMAGYRALRNSWRPLRSTSIAEFWNRYFYYFKELLVDFFFYPVYLRYFKGHPRLRLFAATLCAACFGNVLFHYLDSVAYISEHGPWQTLLSMKVYALYALFLGTAIGISQLRSRNQQRHWLRERVLAPLSVMTFYCVISVFDDLDRSTSVSDHFAFLATLVGMGAG